MRLLRWLIFFAAVAGVYYAAKHTKEVKEAAMDQLPVRLGIGDSDWRHWSHLVDQIQSGQMPDLNEKDWAGLKRMWDSTDNAVHDHAIEVLKFLQRTQYKDKADEVKKNG